MGLIAIALAIGPMLLPLELFERTRGFVDQWIGKFVGFIAHGLGATIVLAMQMQGLQNMLNQVNGVAGTNPPAAVGMLLHCVGDSVLDFLTIAAVPIAFGFGAGTVAALVAPAARLSSATVFAGAQVIKAGGRLARTGSGADA
jgi:type IV secretory pathway VirB6-like protein